MQIMQLNTQGLSPIAPSWLTGKNGKQYLAYPHGKRGRGQWQIQLALSLNDYDDMPPVNESYDLIRIGTNDPAGQPRCFLSPGAKHDRRKLVLWDLEPAPGVSATYGIEGAAERVSEGKVITGEAGNLGFSPAPIVLIHGACRLSWRNPQQWVFEFDGTTAVLMTTEGG